MANAVFSLDDLNIGGVPDKLSSYGAENLGEAGGFDSLTSDYGFSFCKYLPQEQQQQQQPFTDYGLQGWKEIGGIDSLTSEYGFGSQPQEQKQQQPFTDYGLQDREEIGGIDSLTFDYGFSFSKYQPQELKQQQSFADYDHLDGGSFNAASSSIQTCLQEIVKPGQIPTGIQDVDETKKDKKYPFSLSSLGLLRTYGNGFKRLHGVKDITAFTEVADRKLSIEEVMKVAAEMFIQSSCQTIGSKSISMHGHPLNLSFLGLSNQETRDVELAVQLLAAAEKVGYGQYDRASRLLKQCDNMLLKTGNPLQRVVYYFSEALLEKIERETGRSSSKDLRMKPLFNSDEAMMRPSLTILACLSELPFGQITQFAGIQAIVENVAEAKRIHIIDLAIRNGVQWTVLMQALVSRYGCPLELLKVTAVITNDRDLIEGTGRKLLNFAQVLGFPFAFKVVMVSDMLDLKEDLFELDAEETVAVYAASAFRSMLAMPNRIENIMRVIRVINPCLMVVSEIEANHNSPIFVHRFIEALFYFSAYFDCVATCMKENCKNREFIETVYFADGIRNIVAAEGDERKVRHVKFDVWRAFFVRYGMEEAQLSMSSMYQAELILKNFACGSSCTLEMNGKCLIVGWKGTPMHSISVWKFL